MILNSWSSSVVHLSLKEKCYNFCKMFSTVSHLLMLMMILKSAYSRPNQPEHTKYNYSDTNIIKINHIKLINDSFEVDHPTVIYNDDFVDENYVETSSKLSINHYRLLPPEKIYFDIVPPESPEQYDDLNEPELVNMRLVPLTDDINLNTQNSKEDKNWTPRKFSTKIFHNREKRSVENSNVQEIWDKINPFLRNSIYSVYIGDNQNYRKSLLFGSKIYTKIPVPGKKHNALDIPVIPTTTDAAISFEGRVAADEEDRVVFSSGTITTTRSAPTRRPPEPLFRNPNPENFDFSFMNSRNQDNNAVSQNNRQPNRLGVMSASAVVTESPAQLAPPPPTSSMVVANGILSNGPKPTAAPRRISQCVWAIVNCCSTTNNEIRYNCFERNGCYGAFWGLNPCADNVRENIINYVAG